MAHNLLDITTKNGTELINFDMSNFLCTFFTFKKFSEKEKKIIYFCNEIFQKDNKEIFIEQKANNIIYEIYLCSSFFQFFIVGDG